MPSLRRALFLTSLAAGLAAGPAVAGPLLSAQLKVGLGPLQTTFTGVGVTGHSFSDTLVAIDAGTGFAGATTVPSALHLHIFDNTAGTLSGAAPSSVGGILGFFGDWGPASQTFFFPPWAFGLSTTVGSVGSFFPLSASFEGRPWTVGTAHLTGPLFAIPTGATVKITGSNGLTPYGAGTMVLVTPMVFHLTDTIFDDTTSIGAFGVLTLEFAPEPGATALLACGVLAFAWQGRRRVRRRGAA